MDGPAAHAELRSQAQSLLKHPGASISVRGPKPWRKRGTSKAVGLASSLLLYAATLTPVELGLGTTAVAGMGVGAGRAILSEPVDLPPVTVSPPRAAAAFDVPPDMEAPQVARKLLEMGKPFQALAVTLEGLETKPYRDGCGLNVGMGYCIDARVKELGVQRVREDLANAGLDDTQVQALMGNDKAAQAKVEITRTQALSLLALTEPDYRTRARDIVGQPTFDALPAHRQAALTWLSYNTGDGLSGFSKLLGAVRNGQHAEAVKHMTPFFSQGNAMVPNARAGAWMMAAYWSEEALKNALQNPDALEYGARTGQSPIAVVAPKDAGRLEMAGRLPASPYVAHGLAEIKAAGDTATVRVAQVSPQARPSIPVASPGSAIDAEAALPVVEAKSVEEWQRTRQERMEKIRAQSAAQNTPPSTDGLSLLDNLDEGSRQRLLSPRR